MDKLKYIKLENEDGSYSSSIPLAVDAEYVDVNGSTLPSVLNLKADKSTVNADITSLSGRIDSLASGSPAGVYATVAALTAANPDHSKIYVVTENGHWYYYNNGWQDGGEYMQPVLNTEGSTIYYNIDKDVLKSFSLERGPILDFSQMTALAGFIMKNGNTSGVDSGYIHYSIPCNKGDLYYCVSGYCGAAMPLYLFEKNGTILNYYPNPLMSGMDYKFGVLVECPEDGCNLIINSRTNQGAHYTMFSQPIMTKLADPQSEPLVKKDGFNTIDRKILESFNCDWEEIDWKTASTSHTIGNTVPMWEPRTDCIVQASNNSYEEYRMPLTKGETYYFLGADLYQVPAVRIINNTNQKRIVQSALYPSSVQYRKGSYLIYSCQNDNEIASITVPHQIIQDRWFTSDDISNYYRVYKLTGLTRKNNLKLLSTYTPYYLGASDIGNMPEDKKGFFNAVGSIVRGYTKGEVRVYNMLKDCEYKVHSVNWSNVAGLVITDLSYNILYASSTTNYGDTKEHFDYTWTATTPGYIFIADKCAFNSETSYATIELLSSEEDAIIDRKIDANNNVLNPLYGKTAIFDGDSICQADKYGEYTRYGWAGRIGTKNNMTWKNYGVGGGTVTTDTYSYTAVTDYSDLDWNTKTYYKKVSGVSTTTEMYQVVTQSQYVEGMTLYTRGNARHWEAANLTVMHNEYPNADYIILESCLNDGFNVVPLGEISSGYTGTFVTTNYSSAFEYMLSEAIKLWPTAKIGVIIPYRVKNSNIPNYHEKARQACMKWGIPYIDLEKESGINPYIDEQRTLLFNDNATHVNADGYDFFNAKIENWMKTL